MQPFRIASTVVFLAYAASAFAGPVDSARGVLTRTLGPRAKEFVLEALPPANADTFEVVAKGGKVTVRGTTGVAICRGAYEYLREACHAMVTWEEDNLSLPARLPDRPLRRVVCPNRYRHYYNVCTFGYTTAFWDWKRWQREVDWMALHGINMPLAMTGQEAVWQKVFLDMGLKQADLDAFFTGPAFLPWHRMGNVDGHAGPLPQSWIDGQAALQKKILKRERDLGMTPVTPGFSGFVPKAFAQAHPEAAITRSSGWCAFEPTYIVSATDPLFQDIGKRFIQEYRKTFGSDHLYLCDTFNEMTPQVKPETKLQELRAMGDSVYHAILAGDPEGVWVMQGWLFFNDAQFWKEPEAEALLSPVPNDRMIIIDLADDLSEIWRKQPAMRQKGWLYCMLHNFGQTTELFGDLKRYAEGPIKALNDSEHGGMTGMGITPEGIDNNPVVYEMMTDLMWTREPITVKDWVNDYAESRYGQCPPAMRSAWNGLLGTVYSLHTMSTGSRYYRRPSLNDVSEPGIDTARIKQVLIEMLSCSDKLGKVPTYQRDLVDVAKRYLADCSGAILYRAVLARESGKLEQVRQLQNQYIEALADIDRLLATIPEHRLSTWIARAKEWAHTPAERALMEENARLQVTVWGGPVLHDYAWKEWAGLIRDFYIPRWKMLFAAVDSGKPFNAAAMDKALADWELGWTKLRTKPVESKPGDPVAVTRALLAKYSDAATIPQVDRGIAVGKPTTDSGHAEPDGSPANAVDGYAGGTYWSAAPYPQWWQVDLEKPETIAAVQVFPYCEGNRYYQYTVEVSLDGGRWTRVADMSENKEPSKSSGCTHRFAPVQARYVRVNMLFNSANEGVHLYEVRVFH